MHLLQEHDEPKLSNGISKLDSADLETEGSILEEFDNFATKDSKSVLDGHNDLDARAFPGILESIFRARIYIPQQTILPLASIPAKSAFQMF